MNEPDDSGAQTGLGTLADRLSYGAMALGIGVVLLTFRDYGIGWDDPVQARYGDLILGHIASFFNGVATDGRVFSFYNLSLYGGLFEAVAQLLALVMAKTAGFAVVDTRHLATGLVGVLGLVGAWRMARYLGGPVAGLLALLLLAMTPSFTGHAFINSKDIPFAAGTVWTLYFMVRAAVELPGVSWKTSAWLGTALGMTMGVRIGGVVLVAYIGVLLVVHFAWKQARPETKLAGVRQLLNAMAFAALIALLFTFALWPGGWVDPAGMAYTAIMETAKFKSELDVLFGGETYLSTNLPWTYLPVHLWMKLPPVLLLSLAAAFPLSVAGFWRAYGDAERKAVFGYVALGLGIFFPVLFAILMKSTLHDGVRHVLFLMPPMAVLAGVELAALGWRLYRSVSGLAGAAAMVLVLGLVEAGGSMARLHPYAYVYYNTLAGGLKGAEGRYELDYWATSYRAAAGALVLYAEGQPLAQSGRFRVAVCGPQAAAAPFLPPLFETVHQPGEADFLIGITRWSCDNAIEAPIVAEIKRHGVRLSVVRDLRGGFTQTLPYPGSFVLDRF